MYHITIDTGTTNTRVKVWTDSTVISQSSEKAGVRDTAITGSRQTLQQGINKALKTAVKQAGLTLVDIDTILASGMITSNVGLWEVPHISAPAGIQELAQGMVEACIKEVADKSIWFVPGIKNNLESINLENCEAMDIMRGEEAETFGIMESLKLKGPSLLILPGSHSKFVSINSEGKITGCLTTLAGELISVLTHNTILADALNNTFTETVDEELILKGANYAEEVGLNRACFTVRILDRFTHYSAGQKANFLLGAVLQTDLTAIKYSSAMTMKQDIPVIIGGSQVMKHAFELLIGQDDYFTGGLTVVADQVMNDASGIGSLAIARARGLIK